MFLTLAVYLKARTEYSPYTDRIALTYLTGSSMMDVDSGLLLSSQPKHFHTVGSSSLPTSRLFTRAIWSRKGMAKVETISRANKIE